MKKTAKKEKTGFYFRETIIWIIIALLFFLDRTTKEFSKYKTFNTGISFSLLSDSVFFPIILAINVIFLIAIIFIFFRINKKDRKNPLLNLGFIFIISGALGNLYDRIFYNSVIDFINICDYLPTFNFADVFNLIGVLLIIIYLLRRK